MSKKFSTKIYYPLLIAIILASGLFWYAEKKAISAEAKTYQPLVKLAVQKSTAAKKSTTTKPPAQKVSPPPDPSEIIVKLNPKLTAKKKKAMTDYYRTKGYQTENIKTLNKGKLINDLKDDVKELEVQRVKLRNKNNSQTFNVQDKAKLSKEKVAEEQKIIDKEKSITESINDLENLALPELQKVKPQKGKKIKDVLKELNSQSWVDYAEPNYVIKSEGLPNDSRLADQWNLTTIHAAEAWDSIPNSNSQFPNSNPIPNSTIVAVIDTGIESSHEDLSNNIWNNQGEIPNNGIDDDNNGYIDDIQGYDFSTCKVGCSEIKDRTNNPADDTGHGTAVAGIIAAQTNNGLGMAGLDKDNNIKLMNLKFMNEGLGKTTDAIDAIRYAIENHAQVINASWGSTNYSEALREILSLAESQGILVIAACGNSQTNNDQTPHYPSGYGLSNIISVAATDQNDNLASFSNYGPNSVDIAAPGVNILSTAKNNQYNYFSGTSFSAPQVAGTVALIIATMENYPNYNLINQEVTDPLIKIQQIKNYILLGADNLASLQDKIVSNRRLNVNKAISLIQDNIQSSLPHYLIYRATSTINADLSNATLLTSTTDLNFADTTAKPGENYYYAIVAENSNGERSDILVNPEQIEFSSCLPPAVGDWIIEQSCTLESPEAWAPANVIIKPWAVLTIPKDYVLRINLREYRLLVRQDGGVLIKFGGTVKQGKK